MPTAAQESDHAQPIPKVPLPYRRRVIYIVTVVAGLAVVLFFAWKLRWVLTLAFASILFAVFLRGGADLLARLLSPMVKLGRGTSLALFCLLLVGMTALFIALAVPSLSDQFDKLRADLPQSWEAVRERLRSTQWGAWVDQRLGGTPAASPEAVAQRAAGWASNALTGLIALLFFLFMGLYMAAEPSMYTRGVLWLVPPRGRKRADCALKRVGHTLRYWLMGQLVAMAAVGTLTALGLWILGAPLPMVGGVLAAVLEFVPNVGPAVAASVPTLLSFGAECRFFNGPSLAGARSSTTSA